MPIPVESGAEARRLRKPPPPRKRKPAPSSPGSDAAQGNSTRPTAQRPPAVRPQTKTPAAPPRRRAVAPSGINQSPGGDAATGGRNQTRRAARFKKTRAYRDTVKAVYDSLDSDQKLRLLDRIDPRSLEGKIIKRLHSGRERNAAASGRGDTPYTNSERYEVELFKAGAARHPNGRGVVFTGDTQYKDALEAAKKSAAEAFVKKHGAEAVTVHEKDPYKLQAAGFAAPGVVDKLMAAPLALPISGATGAAATAVAAYHDPIGVPKKTAKQLKDITLALPSAVAEMATHPIRTAEQGIDDVSERAGQSFKEKVTRIRKEGAAADIADAAIFVPGAGIAAKPALQTAIKVGLPGAPSRMPSRALRVESGNRVVAPREGGIIRLATGQAKDKLRARAQEASVRRAEAGGKPVDALVAEAVRLNREAGEVVAVAQTRLVRHGKIRRTVAKARARGVYGLKRELNLRTEKVRKLVNRLDAPEKRAFYYAAVYGIRTPEQGERILARLRTNIIEARERDGWEPKGQERKSDMLPDIDAILAAPAGHFTQRLGATVDAITPDSLRAGREDPRLELRQANLRRHAPVAEALNIERGVLDDRRFDARSGDVSIESRRVDPEEFGAAYAKAAEGERGDYLTDYTPEERQTHTLLLSPDGLAGAAVKPDGDIVNVFRLPGAKKGSGLAMVKEAIRHGGFKLDATGSKLRDLYASLGFKLERTEKWDDAYGEPPTPDSDIYYMRLPAPASEKRRRTADAQSPTVPLLNAVVAGGLGEAPLPPLRLVDEGADDYLARVRRAVDEAGLARPLYFRSERYAEEPGYGDHTVGGKGRMAEDAAYTGANLAIGLQDTGIDVYLRGLTRNIKAKHNKRLVDDLLMEHVIARYDTGAYTLRQLRDAVRRDGVAESSVKFWNPGIYRTQLAALRDGDMDVDLHGEGDWAPENLEAMRAATSPGAADQPGWKVLPAAAYRELEHEMTPSMAPGRAYDIGKGWMSKMILLTGNVPWLGAQLIQNGLGALAATGGRAALPTNWATAHKNWSKLTDDEREEIGGWLGLDATASDAQTRRMGGAGGPITQAWHQLHDWGGWKKGLVKGRGPSVADFNPIQGMARLDRAQNNAARIVVWNTLEKGEKVKRLTADAGLLYKLQARVVRKLDGPNGEARLVRDRDLLEQYGRQVEKFMGDFASLTAFERKFVGRAVMFYPFVRFATRLALYTLPVEHPIAGGIVAQLGNMQAEDLKEMYGEDELRWFGGKVPVGDGKTIDLTKLNPLGAPWITSLGENRPAALLGVTPPFVGALYNQLSDKDYFTGGAQHYGEDPSLAYKQGFGSLPLISGTRARAALGDMANLSLAYRALREMDINPAQGFREDERLEEYQGVDSLIVDPKPIQFGGDTADSKAKQKIYSAREQRREERDSWLAQFIPFLPESEDAAVRQREDLKLEKIDAPAPEGKKRGGGYKFGGGGGYDFGG